MTRQKIPLDGMALFSNQDMRRWMRREEFLETSFVERQWWLESWLPTRLSKGWLLVPHHPSNVLFQSQIPKSIQSMRTLGSRIFPGVLHISFATWMNGRAQEKKQLLRQLWQQLLEALLKCPLLPAVYNWSLIQNRMLPLPVTSDCCGGPCCFSPLWDIRDEAGKKWSGLSVSTILSNIGLYKVLIYQIIGKKSLRGLVALHITTSQCDWEEEFVEW